jgi:hypothetical protein
MEPAVHERRELLRVGVDSVVLLDLDPVDDPTPAGARGSKKTMSATSSTV